jgi:hypothetical protein
MLLSVDWVQSLRREGMLTLQVPVFCVGFEDHDLELVEVPDDWFWVLRRDGGYNIPVVSGHGGFLGVSPLGYAVNKAALAGAFINSPVERCFSLKRSKTPKTFYNPAIDPILVEHADIKPATPPGVGQLAFIHKNEEAFDAYASSHFTLVKEATLRVAARPSCPPTRSDALRAAIAKFYGEADFSPHA